MSKAKQAFDPLMSVFTPDMQSITATNVHAVIASKGFWAESQRQFTYTESRTLEQLLHVLDEWGESETTMDEANVLFESADICIVILDLLGAHDLPVQFADCWPYEVLDTLTVPRLLATVAHTYRKTRSLDVERLKLIIGYLRYKLGSVVLANAITAKMLANSKRPTLYGTTDQLKE